MVPEPPSQRQGQAHGDRLRSAAPALPGPHCGEPPAQLSHPGSTNSHLKLSIPLSVQHLLKYNYHALRGYKFTLFSVLGSFVKLSPISYVTKSIRFYNLVAKLQLL